MTEIEQMERRHHRAGFMIDLHQIGVEPRNSSYRKLVTDKPTDGPFASAVEGVGKRNPSASFDPAAGRLDVAVDMRSFDTGDQQRNGILGGKDFFDIAQYPQSRFSASRIERTATGYQAIGSLTLRGVTRNVAIPFTWRTATVRGRSVGYLSGQMTLKRLDFGVGQGQWQSTEWVGDDVTVRYSLSLTASQ